MTPQAPCGERLPVRSPTPETADSAVRMAAVPLDCPMCGLTFVPLDTVCAGCPLHAGCDLARCPRCAYTFPRTSRTWELLRRVFAILRRATRARKEQA